MSASYDVAVVGGSLAGASTALLFARRGLRVALIERQASPLAYKRLCTHFIQPSAVPTIARLGLARAIEAAGGVRNALDVWSRYGWIRAPGGTAPYGYSIRRERLDPLLRATAAAEPGVTLLSGWTARGVRRADGRVAGVVADDPAGRRHEIASRLVVGADGRHSAIAGHAGLAARRRPNQRFMYFAYHRGVWSRPTGAMWFRDGGACYAYPNDDGVVVLAACLPAARLAAFKRDVAGGFTRAFAGLPDGPRLADGERVSPILGCLDAPNVSRPAAVPGLALVGDAALASDPLWAVGCGWAFQSAAWLVDATAAALGAGDEALDRALARYRRRHRRELLGHHLQIASHARRRAFLPHERLLLAAATEDHWVASRVQAIGERLHPLQRLLTPRLLARALRVVAVRRGRVGLLSFGSAG